jgi:hypothetical protein
MTPPQYPLGSVKAVRSCDGLREHWATITRLLTSDER